MAAKKDIPKLKAINGSRSRNKGRDNNMLELSEHLNEEKIEAPKHLDELETKYFDELSEKLKSLGILSSVFTHIQTLCAEEMAQRYHYQKDIKENGATYVSQTLKNIEMRRANPSVMLSEKASNRIKSLLSEMGLSHTSVTRSGARPPRTKGGGGKFDGF